MQREQRKIRKTKKRLSDPILTQQRPRRSHRTNSIICSILTRRIFIWRLICRVRGKCQLKRKLIQYIGLERWHRTVANTIWASNNTHPSGIWIVSLLDFRLVVFFSILFHCNLFYFRYGIDCYSLLSSLKYVHFCLFFVLASGYKASIWLAPIQLLKSVIFVYSFIFFCLIFSSFVVTHSNRRCCIEFLIFFFNFKCVFHKKKSIFTQFYWPLQIEWICRFEFFF